MHDAVCQACAGYGWQWAMRAGVVVRRDPARGVSVRTRLHCTGCSGHGTTPTPGVTLTPQPLPAL